MLDALNSIAQWFQEIGTTIGSIGSFLWGIIKTLFYVLRSIFVFLWDLVSDIMGLDFWDYLGQTLDNLSDYIGYGVVQVGVMIFIILFTMLFNYILRIMTGRISFKKNSK